MASFFDGLELLPGEVVRCSEDAALSAALLNGPRPKSLYVPVHVVVTNARLVLRPATPDAAAALRWPVALPLAGLDTVTFDQSNKTSALMEVVNRDGQIVSLLCSGAAIGVGRNLVNLLVNHKLFSFSFQRDHMAARGPQPTRRVGLYNPFRDFARMGLPDEELILNDTVNANFQLTPSYPAILCLPRQVADRDLFKSSTFRSKKRLPVLVWRAKNTGLLLRSSQPHVGVGRARSEEDENLLRVFSALGKPSSPVLMICDARPRINALANQATTSGGCENTMFYPFSILSFGDIGNIHAARGAAEKLNTLLARAPSEDCDEWSKALQGTGWQKLLWKILSCSRSVADWLLERKNCLLHCSDGWDRTPQCTSLVQLMLDPHYRSADGFACLVEKDWIAFGHQFLWRHGQVAGDDQKVKERAPIFMQFLSCVWQLCVQYPTAFEFSTAFLVRLHRESVSGFCGTFSSNTPRDRSIEELDVTTASVWDTVFFDHDGMLREQYRNALFVPIHGPVLWDPNPASVPFFYELHCWPRIEHAVPPRMSQEELVRSAVVHNAADRIADAVSSSRRLEESMQSLDAHHVELLQRLQHCREELAALRAQARASNVDWATEWILERAFELVKPPPPPPPTLSRALSQPPRSRTSSSASAPSSVIETLPSVTSPPRRNASRPSSAVSWVPDALASTCALCAVAFTWTLRRHHCRTCGCCICASCSSNRMIVVEGQDPGDAVAVECTFSLTISHCSSCM